MLVINPAKMEAEMKDWKHNTTKSSFLTARTDTLLDKEMS